jgi:hypothetical protein
MIYLLVVFFFTTKVTKNIGKIAFALVPLWSILTRTVRAQASQSELYRLGPELRFPCRLTDQILGQLHLDIYQFAAPRAQSMVVPVRHPVKAARTVAELYLGNVPRVLQIPQRVVDGRETYARQEVLRPPKNLIRRQMMLRIADHPQDNLTLLCKS